MIEPNGRNYVKVLKEKGISGRIHDIPFKVSVLFLHFVVNPCLTHFPVLRIESTDNGEILTIRAETQCFRGTELPLFTIPFEGHD